jgi:hypothetical protein
MFLKNNKTITNCLYSTYNGTVLIHNSKFSILKFVKYSTTGKGKKWDYSVEFWKNLRDTASFTAEHAVCAVRARAHRRPERSRRIYSEIKADAVLSKAEG